MSSTRTLLNNFLAPHYDNLDDIEIRVLAGHERLVKESREGDFMSNTFAGDENPHFRWMAAMSGDDLNWHVSPGSSWIFGRNKELTNYRQLLNNPDSGLISIWASPKHMPSLGTSVEVWKKGSTMSPLLPWQEELRDDMRVTSLCNSVDEANGGTLALFRGHHPIMDLSWSNKLKKTYHDIPRACEGLFRGDPKTWRAWDLNLLIQATDSVELLVCDEVKLAVEKALNYRWKEVPDEVVTDSAMLATMFDTWDYVERIEKDIDAPCIFLCDRLRAEEHPTTSLKPLVLLFQVHSGISKLKLLSSLKTTPLDLPVIEDED